ncbi:hypothetical protein CYMTET_2530 [Cymbomonas tetramitiformis]|uniref:Uncharacterized protein n=1 Tax=Cymbomonas tetramitiformis TaxID=36881 RepID=A0AAE0H516_9CHLO|nr:hypothetical protein CYMTET_2530 [Cymbomonas tetramitiformis]
MISGDDLMMLVVVDANGNLEYLVDPTRVGVEFSYSIFFAFGRLDSTRSTRAQDVTVPYQIVERCRSDDDAEGEEEADAEADAPIFASAAPAPRARVIEMSYSYLPDPLTEYALHSEFHQHATIRAYYDVRMRAAPTDASRITDDDAIIPRRECRAHFIFATDETNLPAMHLAIPYLWISTHATILHTRDDTAPCFAAALRTDLPIDRCFLPMISIYADGYALCPLRRVPDKKTIECVSQNMARMPYKFWQRGVFAGDADAIFPEHDDTAVVTSILCTMSDADRVAICVDAATASSYLVVYARLPGNMEGDTWRLCYDNPSGCTWNTLTGSAEMRHTLRFSEKRRSRIAAYLAALLERDASDVSEEKENGAIADYFIGDVARRHSRIYTATGNVLRSSPDPHETPPHSSDGVVSSASPDDREGALSAVPMTVRDEAEFCGALGITDCFRLFARLMNGRPLFLSDRSDNIILATQTACAIAHVISFVNGFMFCALREATPIIGGPRRAVINFAIAVTGTLLHVSSLFNFWLFNSGIAGVAAVAVVRLCPRSREYCTRRYANHPHATSRGGQHEREDSRRSSVVTCRARQPHPTRAHSKAHRHASAAPMPMYVTTSSGYRPSSKISANAEVMRCDTYV